MNTSRLLNELITLQGLLTQSTTTLNDLDITGEYKIDGNLVLSDTTLGSGVVNSSLTSVGTLNGLNITGDYKIAGTKVIDSTSLGSVVVSSSLTSVGTLASITTTGNILQSRTGFAATTTLKSTTNGVVVELNRGASNNENSISFLTAGSLNWIIGADNLPDPNKNDFTIKRVNNGAPDFTILSSNANVGVGDANPTSKLSVAGNITLTGSITTGDTGVVNDFGLMVINTDDESVNIGSAFQLNLAENNCSFFNGFVNINETDESVDIGQNTPLGNKSLSINTTISGLVLPRLNTEQRDLVGNLVAGEILYNTSTNTVQFFNGSVWGDI
jgi:hypothetical protein